MKQSIFTIIENKALTRDVFKMVLEGDTSAITASGQFVNIQLSGKFLRRPISVCDWNETTLTIVYKVVGHGTKQMSEMQVGEQLDILTGLGNGYDLSLAGNAPLLIGGGVGVPPMYGAAKKLAEAGIKAKVILGFNVKDEIFYEEEFKALGCDVTVTLKNSRRWAAMSPSPRSTAATASRASSPMPCLNLTAISTPVARSPC